MDLERGGVVLKRTSRSGDFERWTVGGTVVVCVLRSTRGVDGRGGLIGRGEVVERDGVAGRAGDAERGGDAGRGGAVRVDS